MLLLVLSTGITKAGAADLPDPALYPPCTTEACIPDVVTPDGNPPQAGETVVLVFHGYEPGSTVSITFYVDTNADTILEEVTLTGVADEFGDVEFEWNIPAGVAGDLVYETIGIDDETGEVRRESGSIFVEAEDFVPDTVPGGGGGPLPYTGSNSTNLVRIGLVLIVAGGISVVAVRRRNAHVDA
jgi:LPXTG-motif cell wall-anchored protein